MSINGNITVCVNRDGSPFVCFKYIKSSSFHVFRFALPCAHCLEASGLLAARETSLGSPGALFSKLELSLPVRFSKRVSASRNTLFLLYPRIVAISRAASTLLSSRKAGEVVRATPNSLADSASPCALMIIDCLSCSACSTKYLARSACCYAICFSSMALVNSAPK